MCSLVRGEKVKTFIRVFGQHQSREQPRRFFRLRNLFVRLALFRLAILLEAFDLANRLEIHFAISTVQKRKLAGHSFAQQKPRDLTRFIDLGKR